MKYKKPSAFNVVSVGLVIGTGLVAYVLVYLWPVYSASSRAKGILYDHVPALYKANLHSSDASQAMVCWGWRTPGWVCSAWARRMKRATS